VAKQQTTPEERQRRREQQRERLARATEELLTSEGWRRWLRARATFHSYSLRNTLLIAQQAEERGFTATHVAGFRAWLSLDRCVRKGERGLRILAPMSVRDVDEATGEERRRTFFREAAVFDISQTEPLPGREPVALSPPGGEIEGDSHAELVPALEGLAEQIGYPVAYSDELERAAGVCDRRARRITIRAGMAPNRTAAVLIHELGHALVAEVEDTTLPAAREELLVESVAFVVSAAAGLDVSCEAVPYVASFGGEDAVEQLERCAQAIDAIAGRIEDALELRPKPAEESSAKQGLDRVEPAVDRAPA
jgi:antirestriction protein ArdC